MLTIYVLLFHMQEPTSTPPVVVSTPPITVVCNCDTRTHPSIVVSPGCSHQLRFLPTGQLIKPTEDPPARQISIFRYCYINSAVQISLVAINVYTCTIIEIKQLRAFEMDLGNPPWLACLWFL